MPINPEKTKILLVEDAAVMRNIEIKTLKSLGFTNIVQAEDGAIGISRLKEIPDIDIVISDWNMPNKDGFELLEWIRTSDQWRNLPFIMATGQGDKKQQQKAADAGVSSFIAKPFDGPELKKKIDVALGLGDADAMEGEYQPSVCSASGKVTLRVSHIQITDHLVLGVLRHMIEKGDITPRFFELETVCRSGWNPIADDLEKGRVDAACVLAPIGMDLFSYNVPIRMILLAHKNGSIAIRNLQGDYTPPFNGFFKGKSFLIPHKLSIHHMLSHMFFKNMGLKSGMEEKKGYDVTFEVVPPIQMVDFMRSNEKTCGFMVAEPVGTKAIASGIAELQYLSGELWENHPCCIVAMQKGFIDQHPDAVHEFTQYLVKAGQFIENKPELAAEVAVDFLDPDRKLGLRVPLLKNVLTEKQGIKAGDLYPLIEDFEKMQRYMVDEMGVGSIIDLEQFIDIRFADAACQGRSRSSELHASESVVREILIRGTLQDTETNKAMLNKEGKYLTFRLQDQEYGIDISKVKEIIGMMDVRTIPNADNHVKGVINLRDKIIPIIDLRLKFGMEEAEYTERTCIIVLEMEVNGEDYYMGMVVDTVLEVLNLKSSEIEDTPSFGTPLDTRHILAMAKTQDGRIKILLDIDAILGYEAEKLEEL
ncbi:MAG: response regulator receiver protein [Desulfococcus sp.]|nr:MAG: response regulator receiver protein [Desulfococcus sp.]